MPRIDTQLSRVEQAGELFGGQASWHDAIINVYHPSWTAYAEGYRLAADRLAGIALENRGERDFLIYPVLFLYRQFLELSLKEIVGYAEELVELDAVKRPTGHKLEGLWTRFHIAMSKVSDSSVDEEIEVIKSAVMQFATVDPTSQAFRYPTDQAGDPVRHQFERINLPSLRKEMANAAKALDMVGAGLSAFVDLQRDMLSNMGP
jgi:hypothetical protein